MSLSDPASSAQDPSARDRALEHVRQAAERAAHVPGLPADLRTRPVQRVAVVGAGTMGGGIAMSLATAGL